MKKLSLIVAVGLAAAGLRTAAADDLPPDRLPPDLGTRRAGEDWPCFLGPTQDSKSREAPLSVPWPVAGPPVLWTWPLGTGYGAPVISRGRLFLSDRHGDRAELVALHSETGRLLWKFTYPTAYEDQYGYENGPRCCPVVDGERVYLFGAEGMLYCVRAVDGAEVWKVDTQREFGVVQNFFGVGSTPIVDGDLLLVHVGGSPAGSDRVPFGDLKGNGSALVAFDKRTGKVAWQASDELAGYASPTIATLAQRRLCLVFARGGLVGIEPQNGRVDFHYPWRAPILESVNASNPVVRGDEVLISETYGPGAALLRVKPGGYDVVWSDADKGRDKSLQTHWNTPVEVDGFVYASSGRHTANAELRCVEWSTGAVRWRQGGLGRASLLFADGHFIALCEYGELLLFRANPEKLEVVSGVILKTPAAEADAAKGGNDDKAAAASKAEDVPGIGPRRLLEYPAWAAPVLSHGLLYVRGKDRLVCLEVIPQR